MSLVFLNLRSLEFVRSSRFRRHHLDSTWSQDIRRFLEYLSQRDRTPDFSVGCARSSRRALLRGFGIACAFLIGVGREKKNWGRSTMKFQNIIRSGLVIAGLGAALAFPGSVWAQEITNSTFSDGGNMVALAQPADARQSTGANVNALPGPQAAQASVAIAASAQPRPGNNEQEPTEGSMWAGVAFLWISAAAAFAYAGVKRFVERVRDLRNSPVSTHSA
jgi:hypothetical protein